MFNLKKYFSNKKYNSYAPKNKSTSINALTFHLLHNLKKEISSEGKIDELQFLKKTEYEYKDYQCQLNKLIKLGYIEKNKNTFKILKQHPEYVSFNCTESFHVINYKEDLKRVKCLIIEDEEEFDDLIPINARMYRDITQNNNIPDYRSIEAIGVLSLHVIDKKYYKDYEVHRFVGKLAVRWPWIKLMGSTLEPHLLSFLISQVPFGKSRKMKLSKMMEFFNETKENIEVALINLRNLKLLDFERFNQSFQILLSKNEIVKISCSEKGCNIVKELKQYYVLDILDDEEEEQERIAFCDKMINLEYQQERVCNDE